MHMSICLGLLNQAVMFSHEILAFDPRSGSQFRRVREKEVFERKGFLLHHFLSQSWYFLWMSMTVLGPCRWMNATNFYMLGSLPFIRIPVSPTRHFMLTTHDCWSHPLGSIPEKNAREFVKSNASMYTGSKKKTTSSSCVMQVSITIQQLENQEWCCSSVSFRPNEVLNFVRACEIVTTNEVKAYSYYSLYT